jgi:cytochrome c-type biogenesis protein
VHPGDELLRFVGDRLSELAALGSAPHMLDGPRLYAFALAGGVVGSISPCILGMLPVNVSYIASAGLRTRAAAVRLASLFVAGVALVNVVLGLATALFFAIFIQYRGEVNIVVGIFTVLAALWMVGLLRLPVPQLVKAMPTRFGPLAVGLAFALVTSPCSSPVLFAVLTAASQRGNPLASVGAMSVYSIGYTSVLWAASISTGLIATSRHLLRYGTLVTRASALVLAALGVSSVVYGAALLR